MATLEIDFNCMCVFVPDHKNHRVHVLMPSTSDHNDHNDHSHAAPESGGVAPGCADQHIVRLWHSSFHSQGGSYQGIDMAGWALELGEKSGSADTVLEPLTPARGCPRAVNLTYVADGLQVRRELVPEIPVYHPEVVSRVTLYGGRVTALHAEARWKLKGRTIFMAHRVSWEIDNVPEELKWTPMGGTGDPPLRSLAHLPGSGGSGGTRRYRLSVYHVTPDALPPKDEAVLDPHQARRHFRALYRLLGLCDPGDDLLPEYVPDESALAEKSRAVAKVNCAVAQADLEG